jgi:hypothetical protein
MTTASALKTLYIICHNNARGKSSKTVITSSERSETEGCNGFCKVKTVMLLMRRHDSEKAVYLYTLLI